MNYLKNDFKNMGRIYSCFKNVGKNVYKSDTICIHEIFGDLDKFEFTTIKTTSTFSAASPNCVPFFCRLSVKGFPIHTVGMQIGVYTG